jgi:hypothetical protein
MKERIYQTEFDDDYMFRGTAAKSPEPRLSGSRGIQSRPHQVKNPIQARSSGKLDQSTISITSNNRFEPKLHSFEYKSAAKEAYTRRMTYDPKKSAASSKTGLSTIAGKEYIGGASFVYDDKNKASKSTIEDRRSREFRQKASKLN